MIEAWIVSFSLILARTGTFVAALPYLGGNAVPRTVKVGLVVALSFFWSGAIGELPMDELVARADVHWLAFGLALAREAVLGAVLGFAFGLFLMPARVAGEFVGQEMGLSLGTLTDPSGENAATIVGQLFEVLGVLIFFGLDAHHVWFAALHSTFAGWPVGGPVTLPVVPLVHGLESAHEWGLLLAAPIVVCLFISSVTLALMARTAPQLNLFSVGFTLRLGAGLVAVFVFLPQFVDSFTAVVSRFGEFLARLV
jgi:flagellar biosynthetic protein FliR